MTGFAVVTGASSGIGRALAQEFVDRDYDVLICAEDDQIHDAAAALGGSGSQVRAVQADLAERDGTEALAAAVAHAGRPVDVLALNAGIGNWGPFLETDEQQDHRVIAVNIISPVITAKRVVPRMVARGSGRVLVTSSIAAKAPGPYNSMYSASKAFLQSWAEALRHELRDTGVTVTALLPGPTDTQFFDDADMDETRVAQGKKDDPAEVARQAVDALLAGDHQIVIGWRNKIMVAAAGVLPDSVTAAAAAPANEPRAGADGSD